KEWRVSSRQQDLSLASEFAEDWYLELRGKIRLGEIKSEKTFADAAKTYMAEYTAIIGEERSERYIQCHTAD
ncbi:MAG: site-specific integrase, partial [Cohaesibacter sp.]|nr:site-specific integrase [Cohaesibacter sp.]